MKQKFGPAKKALGQNFLVDSAIAHSIVDALGLVEGDLVCEIGPGRGALTRILMQRPVSLNLIEFDFDLAKHWREQVGSPIRVFAEDAMRFDYNQLVQPDGRKLKIVGNLPYNQGTEILFHLVSFRHLIAEQVFMLQKEVVQRICAQVGTKAYGRLSVMLQLDYELELLFDVPAQAFKPAPKVQSSLVRMQPRQQEMIADEQRPLFAQLIKRAFAQKRKTLYNNLKPWFSKEALIEANIEPNARAEQVSQAQFIKLLDHAEKLIDGN